MAKKNKSGSVSFINTKGSTKIEKNDVFSAEEVIAQNVESESKPYFDPNTGVYYASEADFLKKNKLKLAICGGCVVVVSENDTLPTYNPPDGKVSFDKFLKEGPVPTPPLSLTSDVEFDDPFGRQIDEDFGGLARMEPPLDDEGDEENIEASFQPALEDTFYTTNQTLGEILPCGPIKTLNSKEKKFLQKTLSSAFNVPKKCITLSGADIKNNYVRLNVSKKKSVYEAIALYGLDDQSWCHVDYQSANAIVIDMNFHAMLEWLKFNLELAIS